jgi:hypothetical protein
MSETQKHTPTPDPRGSRGWTLTNTQIIEVGRVLLPYLREGATHADIGTVAYNVCAAMIRVGAVEQDEYCDNLGLGDENVRLSGVNRDLVKALEEAHVALRECVGILSGEYPSLANNVIRPVADRARAALSKAGE